MISSQRDGVAERVARDVLDNLAEGCQVIGFDWTYRYVNDSLVAQAGLSRAQLLGRTMMECYPGIEATAMFSVLRRCMTERAHQRMENAFTFPDGSSGWFELRFVPVPEGTCILSLDITARKRIEQSLRRSQEDLATTLNSIGDGVIATDLAGRVTCLNPAAERLTGWPASAGVGRRLEEVFCIVSEETRAPVEGPVQRVLRDGLTVGLANHTILVSRDGSERPIADSGAPICDDQGGLRGVVLVFRDQSVAAAAEKALRQREEMFRGLLDAAPDAMVIVDARGLITLLNARTEELFGHSRAELVGQPVEVLIPERFRTVHQQHVRGFGRAPHLRLLGRGLDLYGRRRDGTEFPAEVTLSPMPGPDGMLITAAIRDVTERRREEEEKRKLEAQLQQAQKMEFVGRLASGVAHDFNNMLGVIHGYADLTMEQVGSDHPIQEGLAEIKAAATRSVDLVRQLMAFARKQTIAPKLLDLNETTAELLKMLRRLIGENIDLAWRPGPDVWAVKIDPSQLDQILTNLAVNARDAIDGVGRVTIETGTAVFDEEYCAQHVGAIPGHYAMLAVSDTGCGMDQDTQAHIFEPFFTTKRLGKGTGLGLASVYGSVKQNHGFIGVYSEPGQGSTFKLYLPRAQGGADRTPVDSTQAAATGGPETVLVVEDEPALLAIAVSLLEGLGYVVVATARPGDAIRLVEQHPGEIHLVLTDVVMPDMNGRELAKRLHALRPNLKTLFMSGYTSDVIAHQGVLDEGVQFINKPFSRQELAMKVREVLAR